MTTVRQGPSPTRALSDWRRVGRTLRGCLPGAPSLRFCIDAPTELATTSERWVEFRGWAFDPHGEPVSGRVVVGDRPAERLGIGQARPDVAAAYPESPTAERSGFCFEVDLTDHPLGQTIEARLEFQAGERTVRSPVYRLRAAPRHSFQRGQYKETWNAASRTEPEALLGVAGYTDEARLAETATGTLRLLEETVGIRPSDTVLEIGAGVGRVGAVVAPRCKEWIGCDVSEAMLGHLRRRLAHLTNVRTVSLSGYDLQPIPDASVDVVYCTVVFPHLDEWDRFGYVLEAMRVLRPGGRLLVDGFDLLSDRGWAFFLSHRENYHPLARPANISKSSTPQELETYLRRAGFDHIELTHRAGIWIIAHGRKPAG